MRSSLVSYLELAPVSRLWSLASWQTGELLDRQGLEIARHCGKLCELELASGDVRVD